MMKITDKIISILILGLLSPFIFITGCFAGVWSCTSSPIDLQDLPHRMAYYWGISHALGANETIKSASMEFKNINDWQVEDNDFLYVDLFQDAKYGIGVKSFTDMEKPRDYFMGKESQFGEMSRLFVYSDTNAYKQGRRWIDPSENFVYSFNSDQIAALNRAMSDGSFAFGLDPDCHYYNCGIKFSLETENRVPEPATMSFLGLGLFGLAGFRRKK